MRKHVTPAHPRATILDPARNRRLPPEGMPVAWSAYWARLEARGDVTVRAIDAAPAGQESAEAPAPTLDPEAPEPDAHG